MPVGADAHMAALICVSAWLLVCGEFGSFIAAAFAVFETVAGAPAVTTMVKMSLPPAGMSAPVQVTVPEFTQPAEAEANVTPAGKVSVTEMSVAVAVAEFEFDTVIV